MLNVAQALLWHGGQGKKSVDRRFWGATTNGEGNNRATALDRDAQGTHVSEAVSGSLADKASVSIRNLVKVCPRCLSPSLSVSLARSLSLYLNPQP